MLRHFGDTDIFVTQQYWLGANNGDKQKFMCFFFVYLPLIVISIYTLILWGETGYLWRYNIKGFDWDSPGSYVCDVADNYTHEEWNLLQFVRMGSYGFVGSHSDIRPRLFNVDFDFRNVGRQPGYDYLNPHPMTVAYDTTFRPNARY